MLIEIQKTLVDTGWICNQQNPLVTYDNDMLQTIAIKIIRHKPVNIAVHIGNAGSLLHQITLGVLAVVEKTSKNLIFNSSKLVFL